MSTTCRTRSGFRAAVMGAGRPAKLCALRVTEVGGGDAVWMTGRPLHQLDPVAIGVCEPRGLRAGCAAGSLHRSRAQPCPRQRLGRRGEVVDLHDDVAETCADVHRVVGRPVDQLECAYILAGELEHDQAYAVAEVDAADLVVPEGGVETKRGRQVGDAIRGVESLHPATVRLAHSRTLVAKRPRRRNRPDLPLMAQS